ncbi:3-oxoadipate enol-lactonase [Arthrobacter crystallopoietes BAB-32]|uniref:3-oxoadipate enol-lactonase n=1 Tax=Arthrobacter crystallopoietes BAB-32 TaxID=1246476 RepID=N1UWK6_9MICC|nr:alpha/beta hydrolase [Arthrobacter crystallopoietes]EMY32207.1 3-oxoadipate enol-lactonase [Arthrobacter crystallopoietes BAB-32]
MTVPEITPTLLSEGSGKPVLIAGAGLGTGAQALWGDAVPFLADFQVIGVDLPGHGASPASTETFTVAELAAAVATVVEKLRASGEIANDAPVYYAGVSLAGALGLQLGLDYPELFKGIGVLCSGAKIGEPQAWLDRAETVRTAGTPTMVEGSAQRWFAPGFIESHAEATTRLLHTLQNADRFAYAHACEALAGFDVRERLGEIATPVIAIAGGQDDVCPPPFAEATAAGVRNGRAAVVASAAHQAPLEAPEETAKLLREFFLAA